MNKDRYNIIITMFTNTSDTQCLAKLYSLLGAHAEKTRILEIMLEHDCVFAGGSVVFALCDFVDKETVGDIDAFMPITSKIEAMLKAISNIPYLRLCKARSRYTTSSIIEVWVEDATIPIQIISSKYTDAEDVVTAFDMDYVQCAMTKLGVNKTFACGVAHSTRRVHKAAFPILLSRYNKVINKGFKIAALPTVYEHDVNRIQSCDDINTAMKPTAFERRILEPIHHFERHFKLFRHSITREHTTSVVSKWQPMKCAIVKHDIDDPILLDMGAIKFALGLLDGVINIDIAKKQ